MPLIKPTVGRIVNFVEETNDGVPTIRPAIIVAVHSDTCVSLHVFRAPWDKSTSGCESSRMLDDAEKPQPATWHWMPYQTGQAAKSDALLAVLEARVAELEARLAAATAATAPAAVPVGTEPTSAAPAQPSPAAEAAPSSPA